MPDERRKRRGVPLLKGPAERTSAQGLTTNAVRSPAIAPLAVGIALFEDKTLPAPAATVSFSGIANTHKHLRLVWHARSTLNDSDPLYLQINGSTAAIYDYQIITNGVSTSIVNSAAQIPLGSITGAANAEAAAAGGGVADILNYANGAWWPVVQGQSGWRGTTDAQVCTFTGYRRFHTPISSLLLFMGTSRQFATGSRFTLYGVN